MYQTIAIDRASDTDRSSLETLLHSLNLPIEDLPGTLENFIIAKEAGNIIGSAGLEVYGSYALLRSLAVSTSTQGKGVGHRLYRAIMQLATEKAVKEVYLITTTAAPFFEKQGFVKADRLSVPAPIRNTAQFSSVCPSSATVMQRKIA